MSVANNRPLSHITRLAAIFGAAALLLVSWPAAPFASTEAKGHAGRSGSVNGTVLSAYGEGLGGVVITLEPFGRLREAGDDVTPRVQTEQATLLNRGGRFTPELLVVTVGTTASFRSWDGLFHTAHLFIEGRELDHLPLPANGLDARYTFTAPGIITLRDERAPEQEPAHIVVLQHRNFAVSDHQGRFTVDALAPGRYRLRCWHKALREDREFLVTAKSGKAVTVELLLTED